MTAALIRAAFVMGEIINLPLEAILPSLSASNPPATLIVCFLIKEDMNYIANRLRRCRRVRGLRQNEVARLLGVKNASMISRWEKGITLPSLLNAVKLAVIYRTMVDALYLDLTATLKEEIMKKEEALRK